MPLPILYHDDFLVAVHKPSGLLVHRSMLARHEEAFALQMVRDQIGRRVYPVHRLDRGTSGVLLFALDKDTARQVGEQFAAQTVAKTYLAVVRGHPPEQGVIDHPLKRQHDALEWVGEQASHEAQAAVTQFQRLACCELPWAVERYPTSRYALLALFPQTGRQHQIRRHLKHIAHPIIGDATYGKGKHNRAFQAHFGCQRLLLACSKMELRHPISGELLTLQAPLDKDFLDVLEQMPWVEGLPDLLT